MYDSFVPEHISSRSDNRSIYTKTATLPTNFSYTIQRRKKFSREKNFFGSLLTENGGWYFRGKCLKVIYFIESSFGMHIIPRTYLFRSIHE